ncbi:MAG: SLC13 family permease, partial [Candidatus Odinarchaeota archaeon]
KDLSRQISEFEYARILLIDEKIVIADPKSFRNAAIILLATIIGFAIASFLPFTLDLGFIALAGGFAMVGFVEIDVEEALRTIELPLVFFLAGLLTIIGIAEETGVLELIAAPVEILFSLNLFGGVIALLWVNALASAVLDNVPVASIMTGVMDRLMVDYPSIPFSPLLLSVVIGTNLGGNITPIGSASTVQAIEMLHRSERIDAKASFLEFVKYGGMVTFGQLIVGSIYIGLIWTIGTIFSM